MLPFVWTISKYHIMLSTIICMSNFPNREINVKSTCISPDVHLSVTSTRAILILIYKMFNLSTIHKRSIMWRRWSVEWIGWKGGIWTTWLWKKNYFFQRDCWNTTFLPLFTSLCHWIRKFSVTFPEFKWNRSQLFVASGIKLLNSFDFKFLHHQRFSIRVQMIKYMPTCWGTGIWKYQNLVILPFIFIHSTQKSSTL